MSKPWLDVPEVWKDEQAFLNWMRSQIRRVWSRHPIKVEYVKRRQITVEHAKEFGVEFGHCLHPRTKTVCRCEHCHLWFAKNQMEVDHIEGGTGFADYESFLQWQKRMLFVDFGDIQHLCKKCHHKVSMTQKFHCKPEEVQAYIDRANFRKFTAKMQQSALRAMGYTPGKNAKEREAQYTRYLEQYYGFTLRP